MTVTAIDQRLNVFQSVPPESVDVSPPVKPLTITPFAVVSKDTLETPGSNVTNVNIEFSI